MVVQILGKQFSEAEGVGDWRVLFMGAKAYFATGSFERGVALIDAIAKIAESAGHHPDIDLRYSGVIVRVFTADDHALTDLDLALARQISVAARELGIAADPSRVQTVQLSIDALVIADILPFWKAVLGYIKIDGEDDLEDPMWNSANVTFQQMDEPRIERNRIHFDVSVPRDQAEARIAAALAAGGHLVRDEGPWWWTLADSEGNEVDIAPWADDQVPHSG